MCLEDINWSDDLNELLDKAQANLINVAYSEGEPSKPELEKAWRSTWETCGVSLPLNGTDQEIKDAFKKTLTQYFTGLPTDIRNYNFRNCL